MVEEAGRHLEETGAEAEEARRVVEEETDVKIAVAQIERQREYDAAESEAVREAEKGRLAAEARARERVQEAVERRRVDDLRTAGDIADAWNDYERAGQKAEALEHAADAARREVRNERGDES